MRRGRMRVALLASAACLFGPEVPAGDIEYLKKNERFCDLAETVCLRGTISYRVNERVVEVHARVERSTGPGRLRIGLSGQNRQALRRATALEVGIDGHASEIVSVRMIPDAPDVYSWHIDSIVFEPD